MVEVELLWKCDQNEQNVVVLEIFIFYLFEGWSDTEGELEISHPLFHLSNGRNNLDWPGQHREARIPFESPVWRAGTPKHESSSAFPDYWGAGMEASHPEGEPGP